MKHFFSFIVKNYLSHFNKLFSLNKTILFLLNKLKNFKKKLYF